METAPERLTVKGLVLFASLSIFFELLHLTGDVLRGEGVRAYGNDGNFAIFHLILGTAYIFGIGWTWKGRRYGYATLLILSIFPIFTGTFLIHAFGLLGRDSLSTIGTFYSDPSLGALFVFATLASGLASLTTILLAGYVLAFKKKT